MTCHHHFITIATSRNHCHSRQRHLSSPRPSPRSEQNRFYKKAAAFCLRAVAKHSPQLAQAVIDSGALDALVVCLEEFDPGVKEAAAWVSYCLSHGDGHAGSPLCPVATGTQVACVACLPVSLSALVQLTARAWSPSPASHPLGATTRHPRTLRLR